MRTLSNAGELNPGEEPRPVDGDVVADRARPHARRARRAVRDRARRTPPCPTRSATSSSGSGAGSALAAPIRFDDGVWGVLEAYSAVGAPPFTPSHVRFARGAVRPGRDGDRPRRAVLAAGVARLPGPAHAAAEPARARRAAGGGGRALRRRRGGELALLFCDLDGLKDVNDRHGHDAGDRALQAAGAALAEAAEAFPGSFTSRLGGDEFCVLMEGHGADAARALARDASRAARRRARRAAHLLLRRRRASTPSTAARPTCSAPPTPRSTPPSASAAAGVFVAEPGIPPRSGAEAGVAPALPRRRPARARGARARPCSSCSTATSTARASWRGSRRSTGAFAEAFDAARWAISRRAARGGGGRDRARRRSGATAHDARRPLQRRGRVLRARRLPAHRGDARARRRLRDRRRATRRPTRASARCWPSGASRP